MTKFFWAIYSLCSAFTFIFLMFLDGYVYTWWNWAIALPINAFLAAVWPIYWGILRWLVQ